MPYDQNESRQITAKAFARLSARAAGLPRLAVAGEFSSGKSTLLNLLIGEDILPTRATATAAPAIWLAWGSRPGAYADAAGMLQPLPPGGIADVPQDARFIRIWREAHFLRECEILDLSGFSDPGRPDQQSLDLLRLAHCVIWCSPATQAWRQSERAAWLAAPERLHHSSILAITGCDKLRNEQEVSRVMRRVSHEAAELFNSCLPVSAHIATEALQSEDETLWDQSGIDALMEALNLRFEALHRKRSGLLSRYAVLPNAEDLSQEAVTAEAEPQHIVQLQPEPETMSEPEPPPAPEMADAPQPFEDVPGLPSLLVAAPAPLLLAEFILPAAEPEAEPEAQADWEAALAEEPPEAPLQADPFSDAFDPAAFSAGLMAQEPEGRGAEQDPQPSPDAPHETAPEPELIPGIEAALQKVLSDFFTLPPAAPVSGPLPRETKIWREIAAGTALPPGQMPLVAMIDQLLTAIFSEKGTENSPVARIE